MSSHHTNNNNSNSNYHDDDEEMGSAQYEAPSRPVLVRYEVANNVFEVPERYQLQYAIGQGAYGIVW